MRRHHAVFLVLIVCLLFVAHDSAVRNTEAAQEPKEAADFFTAEDTTPMESPTAPTSIHRPAQPLPETPPPPTRAPLPLIAVPRPATFEEAVSYVAYHLDKGTFEHSQLANLGAVIGSARIEQIGFGSNPSMQAAFNVMRRNFDASKKDQLSEISAEERLDAIPLLGCLCTTFDFPFLLNLIHHIDVPVMGYAIVVNGHAPLAKVFVAAAQLLLPEFVFATLYDKNEGVSRGWNIAIKRAFVLTHPPRRSVIIANSDIMFPPGRLGPALKTFHTDPNMLLVRFHDFAFFGMNRAAFSLFGYADEVLYPAYAEDVDLHLRMVAIGKGSDTYLGNFHGLDSHHFVSINVKRDPQTRAMWLRGGRDGYLRAKWGVDIRAHRDFQHAVPYRHPFNNPKILVNNSWIVDPNHRQCIEVGTSPNCEYDVRTTAALENVELKDATHLGF